MTAGRFTTIECNGISYRITNLYYAFSGHNSSLKKIPRVSRILLENLIRHMDGKLVTEENIREFHSGSLDNVLFYPSRLLLQDMLGVPLLVDLACMRDAMARAGKDPSIINPQIPLDFIIDHSLMAVEGGHLGARKLNEAKEFERNEERFSFLKWCGQSFNNLRVIPPDKGILHQLHIECLARVANVEENSGNLIVPDTVVGTDSHTPMVNGIGVLGWGVGGIEAEAAMLGQPLSIAMPRIVGIKLKGSLNSGINATDLVLTITNFLREKGVVGAFLEFFGESLKELPLTTRTTISNMAPEYGATCVYFPIDDKTIDYLEMTGRDKEQINLIKKYAEYFGLWANKDSINPEYNEIFEFDLDTVQTSLAGPSRPHDLIDLKDVPESFKKTAICLRAVSRTQDGETPIEGFNHMMMDGDIVIAAITSCTNTSNPEVMMAAGLLAKKAARRGLAKKAWIKTTLAPGSKVVADYLEKAGLQSYLDKLGYHVVGFGCTSCNGMSGPLKPEISAAIKQGQHVVVSVLSGNRNFEARIHPEVKANYLASPPMVIAYAIAGNIYHDMKKDPLGHDKDGNEVYLKDIWPSDKEIQKYISSSVNADLFYNSYESLMQGSALWEELDTGTGSLYNWDPNSTYLKRPPYFENLPENPVMRTCFANLRLFVLLGDTVTTDHISPSGSITDSSAAGRYLTEKGVLVEDYNSYGLRRGNHEIGLRSGFANIQLKNELCDGRIGSYAKLMPEKEIMNLFEAAMIYKARKEELFVIAGDEYGAGSSRDMAAKAVQMMGVKVIVAVGFERIHRTNLIGMGVLPLQFEDPNDRNKMIFKGSELFSVMFEKDEIVSKGKAMLNVVYQSGKTESFSLIVRLDTTDELEYYRHGGILPFVFRKYNNL